MGLSVLWWGIEERRSSVSGMDRGTRYGTSVEF